MTRRTTGRLLGFWLVLGCSLASCTQNPSATQAPASTNQAVISLQDIACQSCGQTVVTALTKTPGVHDAVFEKDTAEIRVVYNADLTGPAKFIAVAQDFGYRASEGPGQGAYTPEVTFPANLDVQQISTHGENVALAAHIAPNKVTVFDFHAIWCGPCKKVDQHMLTVLRKRQDVALRKLNIIDWDSPVAQEYVAGVPNLPYVIVYSADGKRIAEISGLKLDALDAAIREGQRP